MIKDKIQNIIKKNGLDQIDHILIFRFFERQHDDDLIVASFEIKHLNKKMRYINIVTEMQKMYNIPLKYFRLSLDAIEQLQIYFEKNEYFFEKTTYETNNWADNVVTFSKKIDIKNINVELENFFEFYYNLCMDYNVPMNSITD
jgi:hypothetical protein